MSLTITQIDIGAEPNDGTGTPLRDAFQLINTNFASIETVVGSGDFGNISANLLATSNLTTDSLEVTGAANLNTVTANSAFVSGTITATEIVGSLSGVASSAIKLETPRLVNGTPFDGTQDINISIDNYTIDGGGF